MKSVLKGVEKHLSSPIQQMRTLGMIVGEILMNQLNEEKNLEKCLKFEVRLEFGKLTIKKCFFIIV
jgi:hypothetical protein